MEPQPLSRQALGLAAETAAGQWLADHGYRTVARNFRSRRGEIDLIVCQADLLVFVEVRYRTSSGFGGAPASVTHAKQQKIIAAARYFLHHQPRFHHHAVRFDVIAMGGKPGNWRFQWIPAAFLAE